MSVSIVSCSRRKLTSRHPQLGWYPGFSVGGSGFVAAFTVRNDNIYLQFDWGYEFPIDESTTILEEEPDYE